MRDLLFGSAITADGLISVVGKKYPEIHEALHLLNDDLQTVKDELYRSRVNTDTDFFERYNSGTKRFEPVAINQPDKFGLRTNTPDGDIHVVGIRETAATLILETNSNTAGTRNQQFFRKSGDYYTQRSAVGNNSTVGDIEWDAHDGGAFRAVAIVRGLAVTVTGSDDISGELRFFTRPDGAAAVIGLRMGVSKEGNVFIGNRTAQLLTTDTDGFLHIPSCDGAPTGVPTQITGVVPMVYDTRNLVLYVYDFVGGAWTAH